MVLRFNRIVAPSLGIVLRNVQYKPFNMFNTRHFLRNVQYKPFNMFNTRHFSKYWVKQSSAFTKQCDFNPSISNRTVLTISKRNPAGNLNICNMEKHFNTISPCISHGPSSVHYPDYTRPILKPKVTILSNAHRGFRGKPGHTLEEETTRVVSQIQEQEDLQRDSAAWLIRLANENGYLSWSRNAYIATIAGATMYAQDILGSYSKEAGVLLLILGAFHMVSGTTGYVYNILHLREQILMGRVAAMYNVFLAVLHLLLWVGCVALYLGYVEEDELEEDRETHEIKIV